MKSSAAMCVVLLVFLVSSAAALQCYQCSDCGNSIGSEKNCLPGLDSCMKLTVDGHITKTCNLKFACDSFKTVDLTSIQTAVRKLFGSVNKDFSEKSLKDLQVECCQGDYCNSGTTTFINPLLLFLPILIFLIRV